MVKINNEIKNYGKQKKYKFLWYEFYERNSLILLLENMAKSGWMLEDIQKNIAVFRKQEPKNYKFYVDIFHGISKFDLNRTKAQEEYERAYEKQGWNYVTSIRRFPIFYAEEEVASIELDIQEEKKAVFHLFKREVLPLWLFVIGFLGISFVGSKREMNFYALSSSLMLIQRLFFFLLLVSALIGITGWISFLFQYRKNLKQGLGFPTVSPFVERVRKSLLGLGVASAFFILLVTIRLESVYNGYIGLKTYIMGIFPFLFVLCITVPVWQKIGRYRTRQWNLKVYLICCCIYLGMTTGFIVWGMIERNNQEDTPIISMTSLGEEEKGSSFERRESFALLWEKYRGLSNEWYFSYELVKGKNKYYYDTGLRTVFKKYYEQLKERGGTMKVVEEDWGAETVIAVTEKEKSPYYLERILFFPNDVMIWIEVDRNKVQEKVNKNRWKELVLEIHDSITMEPTSFHNERRSGNVKQE